jgi:hypothetical protein
MSAGGATSAPELIVPQDHSFPQCGFLPDGLPKKCLTAFSGHRQSPADFADGFFRAFLLFGSFILKEAVTAKSAQGVIFHRTCR